MTDRILFVGPYPTMPGPEARAALDSVRALVAEGHDVTVVSPVPSAAHYHADPGGAKGALRLASLAGGADRIIIRLDALALHAAGDPPAALPGRLALAGALRRARRVDAVVDRVPATVSRRWATLVLGPAATVTVGSARERDALTAAGVALHRLAVVAPPPPEDLPARRALEDRTLPAAPSARDLQRLIRERAAVKSSGRASVPLRHLPPLERAPVKSLKPGVAYVKKLEARLLGWQFDWIIEHLNKLHQAAIESVEGIEDQPRRGSDSTSS